MCAVATSPYAREFNIRAEPLFKQSTTLTMGHTMRVFHNLIIDDDIIQ